MSSVVRERYLGLPREDAQGFKSFFKAVLGFNLAALPHLVIGGPSRLAKVCSHCYFATKPQKAEVYDIPEVHLSEILGSRTAQFNMIAQPAEDGVMPSDQLFALLTVLIAEQPREVLEIGTFMGRTTRSMAENLPGSIVHTVDLPEDFSAATDSNPESNKDDFHLITNRNVGRDYKGQPCESRIRQHFADTSTWDFKEAGNPGFFFIDGSHTYEHCLIDSERCLGIAAPGAVFVWHDCDSGHPGVLKFIREWREKGRDIRRISGTPLAYWKMTD